MSYKTTDALMRHLRNNGIRISGSSQKRQLINTGYYHGYKGYRFFVDSSHRLPFSSYDEIYATIQYDNKLKALLYSKMMFIETAVKNIALESILINSRSENIRDILDRSISGYHNAPSGTPLKKRKDYQEKKLRLQNSIHLTLSKAYNKDVPSIAHFYNNSNYCDVPVWALFENITMGDFGNLLSCLTFSVRDDITSRLGIDCSTDTNRELIYKYIYTLKDLRNAIAHNSVIFDGRFRKIDPTPAMKACLASEFSLPYVNFKTIGDYVFLMCYYLKLLHVSKTDRKAFLRQFKDVTDEYINNVNPAVSSIVIHPNLMSRIETVKSFL